MEKYSDRTSLIGADFANSRLMIVLFGIYTVLSFFEIYLTGYIGNITKYYLLFLIFAYLYKYRWKIKFNIYSACLGMWFLIKLISILWSNMSNDDVSTTLLSQIGMILFTIVITSRVHDEKAINCFLLQVLFTSGVFGILSVLFSKPYISERFATRQVLTLFGIQNDPNNCAVFMAFGVALAAFSLVYEKKKIFLNAAIIIINSYAIMLTSSRAGFVILGLIIVLIIILPGSRADYNLRTQLWKLLGAIVIIVGLYYVVSRFLPVANIERLLAFSEYSDGSGRKAKWDVALELFTQKPILGWGWGGYNIQLGQGAIHNTFLTSLCDVGLVGTVFLVIPLLALTVKSIRERNVIVSLFMIICLVPAMSLEVANKRFFWNTIIIAVMLLEYQEHHDIQIGVWGN